MTTLLRLMRFDLLNKSLASISGRLLYISRLFWLVFYNVEQQFKGSGTLDGPNLWAHPLTVEQRAREQEILIKHS